MTHSGDPKKRDVLRHEQRRARRPLTENVLRRSRNRWVAGVVGGVAEYLNANPTALRWGFVALICLSLGIVLLPYALLWLFLPGPSA